MNERRADREKWRTSNEELTLSGQNRSVWPFCRTYHVLTTPQANIVDKKGELVY
jgi:hypothetical protein